jgi:hypothetical protein
MKKPSIIIISCFLFINSETEFKAQETNGNYDMILLHGKGRYTEYVVSSGTKINIIAIDGYYPQEKGKLFTSGIRQTKERNIIQRVNLNNCMSYCMQK